MLTKLKLLFVFLGIVLLVSSCYQADITTEIKETGEVYREIYFQISKEKMESLEQMGEGFGGDTTESEENTEEEESDIDMSKECYQDYDWNVESEEDEEYYTYKTYKTFDSVQKMIEEMTEVQKCEAEEEADQEEETPIQISYTTKDGMLIYREKGLLGDTQSQMGSETEEESEGKEGESDAENPMAQGMKGMMKGFMAGFEYTFTLTLPNKIEDSNATEVDGKTAKWVYTLDDMMNNKPFEVYAKCKK